jgi:hypothetical protein
MAKTKEVVDHGAISGASPETPAQEAPNEGAKEVVAFFGDPAPALENKQGESDPIFESVITGKEFGPPKILVYGIDGVGKSTFAAQAPNPIFIQTGHDEGLKQIGATRFPASDTYQDFITKLKSVAIAKHGFQTVVIDGVSGLEALIYKQVADDHGKANIDLVGGGFDRGQKLAMTQWNEVLTLLNACVARGMAVVLVAHARSEKIGDPENPMAEQYGPALHRKTSGELFRRWADMTLFMTRRMTVKKEGQGIMEKTVAVPIGAEGGERIIRTAWTPASVAKNRFDMPLEIPFPKNGSWDVVMGYVQAFYSKG